MAPDALTERSVTAAVSDEEHSFVHREGLKLWSSLRLSERLGRRDLLLAGLSARFIFCAFMWTEEIRDFRTRIPVV